MFSDSQGTFVFFIVHVARCIIIQHFREQLVLSDFTEFANTEQFQEQLIPRIT